MAGDGDEYDLQPPPLSDDLVNHRFSQLLNAGYAAHDASHLAAQPGLDMRIALALMAKGCPSDLAVDILT